MPLLPAVIVTGLLGAGSFYQGLCLTDACLRGFFQAQQIRLLNLLILGIQMPARSDGPGCECAQRYLCIYARRQ